MTGYKGPPRRAHAGVPPKWANAYILVLQRILQQGCAEFGIPGSS